MAKQMNPKSLANLKPAQKGEPSRNPKGRPPKVKTIGDILRKIGAEKLPKSIVESAAEIFPKAANMTMLEAAIRMTYVHALKGGAWAIEFIAERTEGKITQPIEVSPFSEVDWDKLNALPLDELRVLAGYVKKKTKPKPKSKNDNTPKTP